MVFKKIAFNMRDNRKICKEILNEEFEEVHRYMDGSGGKDHRKKHGHNQEAEKEIREKYGEKGVDAFIIHLICDDIHQTYLQKMIIPEVKKIFKEIKEGKAKPPYFEKNDGLFCQTQVNSGAADPDAKITAVLNGCQACGNTNNVVIKNMNAICIDCIEKRGLTICAQCHKPVAETLALPDKIDGRHTVCKVCNP